MEKPTKQERIERLVGYLALLAHRHKEVPDDIVNAILDRIEHIKSLDE